MSPTAALIHNTMKITSLLIVSVCIAFGPAESAMAQKDRSSQAKEIVLSLPPADLINLLPPPPENWKLTTSSARSEITAHPALQTIATRDYVFVPPFTPNGEQTASDSAPIKKTQIVLIDSGFAPAVFFAFQKFKSKSPGTAGTKKYLIEKMKVIETVRGNKRSVSVAVSDRFLVAFITENQNEKETATWLKLLNLPALLSASQIAPKSEIPKDSLLVAAIDELQPETNQASLVPYLSKKEEAERQDAYDKVAEEYLKSNPELQAAIEAERKADAEAKARK